MRFNQTFFVTLAGFIALAPSLQPVWAIQPKGEAAETKNQGRKLSMTLPGLGTANITVTPLAAPAGANSTANGGPLLNFGKPLPAGQKVKLGEIKPRASAQPIAAKGLSVETHGNNVTVRVPSSVDEAIDDAQVFTRQIGRYANNGMQGVGRFFTAMGSYFKQLTGGHTITPAGSPYEQSSHFSGPLPATTVASGHKLYYTSEGRLKSVVNR